MKRRTAWLCLIAAGMLEIVWAYFLKESRGLTEILPTVLAILFIIISFFLLERGITTFGIGISYAVFTGIGIVGTTLVGILLLDEAAGWLKIGSVAILMIGIIGLNLCDGEEGQT